MAAAKGSDPTRATWFDFTDLLGGAPIKAILSQKNSDDQFTDLDDYRRELAYGLGLPLERIAIPQQVHGNKVASAVPGQFHKCVDGLISDDPHVVLSLKVADCAPVFLYDRPSGFRGLIHAGWRGLSTGIITAATDLLQARGAELHRIKVVIGPAIEMACYEVDVEVAELFSSSVNQLNSNGMYQLDLVGAVREQLIKAGIPEPGISRVNVCTRCDPRCHSYRRDGEQAGRMVAFFYQQP
ncbi:polyphenol oxidase family protein [Candidatus Neomarinimicrobiota bacterium]